MKALIAGIVNIETTLKIKNFPIQYYPIDYPFFGIHSDVAGVAYNVTKALRALGDDISLFSYIAKDDEGIRIQSRLKEEGISTLNISDELAQTPLSVVLFDESGRRQIYCDLKDIQEKNLPINHKTAEQLEQCDLIIACNTNFNRTLIRKAKEIGKTIATDVHVISDIDDPFNRDFMECADILFMSDEQLPCTPEKFARQLAEKFTHQIIVIGMGEKGAMLYERASHKIYKLGAVKCDHIINTVGAGDALFSGFLHYYSKGYSPVKALICAEIFASFKIGYNGAAKGFCNEEYIGQVFEEKKPAVNEII